MLPNGPRNRKKDLGEEWFKDDTPVWINSRGNPVGRVDLSLFSEMCGTHVIAGDMRKFFSDVLFYNPNKVRISQI